MSYILLYPCYVSIDNSSTEYDEIALMIIYHLNNNNSNNNNKYLNDPAVLTMWKYELSPGQQADDQVR